MARKQAGTFLGGQLALTYIGGKTWAGWSGNGVTIFKVLI